MFQVLYILHFDGILGGIQVPKIVVDLHKYGSHIDDVVEKYIICS